MMSRLMIGVIVIIILLLIYMYNTSVPAKSCINCGSTSRGGNKCPSNK